MTLTELRYVVTLARERHFGRAAEKCHVSQPTLSVALKKLGKRFVLVFLFCSASALADTTPEALERFALTDLKFWLVDTEAPCEPVVYILDPDGYAHRAIRGNYIGKNNGVIIEIEAREIVISEIYKNELWDDFEEKNIVVPVIEQETIKDEPSKGVQP